MERAVMAICAWTVLTVIPPTRMSAADELKVYKCTRAASPPALDGRLDDVCWRGMDKTAVFTTEGGNPAQEQTTAMLVYGEDALYIGFECRESDMAGVAARVTSHDGPVWNDDCIEAFIDINNKSYYHFMANSLGTRYEEKGRDGSWNIDWQAAAGKEKNAWCVEMRIPFLSLDSIPEEGGLWRLNLNREHHAGGKAELSSWSDTGGSFHAPDRFGYLVFNSYSACLRRIVPEYLEAKTKLFQLFKSYPGQSEKIRERLKPAIAKADELAGNCGILSTETTPGEFIGFLIPVLEVKEALATAPEKIIPAVVKGPYLQKLTENSAVIMWESNVKTISIRRSTVPTR